MSRDRFHAIERALSNAAAFGSTTSENGARLYGHVPHVGAQAWLHIVYSGLDDVGLAQLRRNLGSIPPDYEQFLRWSNGLYLFSGALSLYGLRRDNSRRAAVREPFDLATPNVFERPAQALPSWFIFGFYKADGSHAYLDTADNKVYRADRDMTSPRLNRWNALDTFLTDEIGRLSTHFDAQGRRLDRSQPTTPPEELRRS